MEHLFDWMSLQTEPKPPLVDDVTLALWKAVCVGEKVAVRSTYGLPAPGWRGCIVHNCGCGFPLKRNVGYQIQDAEGGEYIVDSIALHLVACHRKKILPWEMEILLKLPKCELLEDEVGLRQILNAKYPLQPQKYDPQVTCGTKPKHADVQFLSPYKLFKDGRRFYATYRPEHKEIAEQCALRIGGVVCPFWVEIMRRDPTTKDVTEWEQRDGYSVWV